jgi:hypothetical protein
VSVGEKVFFFLFFCSCSLQARDAAKSGLVLFHEAVKGLQCWKPKVERFERAAAKGHEEAIWIVSVVKDVGTDRDAWREAFAKTEEPLGWYFAGYVSEWESRERFDFMKQSAEGGCGWGQVAYGYYFKFGRAGFVETDEKVYVEWLEKAVNQNNPWGMDLLGEWFRNEGDDKEKAVSYHRRGTELGWKDSKTRLADKLTEGER